MCTYIEVWYHTITPYLWPMVPYGTERTGKALTLIDIDIDYIDQNSKHARLSKATSKDIDELIKKNDNLEVYRLLCQVRRYEINPAHVPAVMQEERDGDTEVFVLTQGDDDGGDGKDCLNVDEYITHVLLPRHEIVSRPDCVMSTSLKNALLSPKSTWLEEEQAATKHALAGKTVIEAQEVSAPSVTNASASRSSMVQFKSIDNSVRSFQVKIPDDIVGHLYQMKGRKKALAKRDRFLSIGVLVKMKERNVCVKNFSIMPSQRAFLPNRQHSLAREWRSQSRRRSKGEWLPSGHITGRWKRPGWANLASVGDSPIISRSSASKKYSGCKKSLLPTLHSLISSYMKATTSAASCTVDSPFKSLQDVSCPIFFNPNTDLLWHAHRAVSSLLPDGDCENFDVVKLARYVKSVYESLDFPTLSLTRYFRVV